MAKLDSAAKEVLLNLLRNLRVSTENTHHAAEMSWRTYAALVKMFPEFHDHYQKADGVTFEKMLHWRDDQIRQLDAAIQLAETLL